MIAQNRIHKTIYWNIRLLARQPCAPQYDTSTQNISKCLKVFSNVLTIPCPNIVNPQSDILPIPSPVIMKIPVYVQGDEDLGIPILSLIKLKYVRVAIICYFPERWKSWKIWLMRLSHPNITETLGSC